MMAASRGRRKLFQCESRVDRNSRRCLPRMIYDHIEWSYIIRGKNALKPRVLGLCCGKDFFERGF